MAYYFTTFEPYKDSAGVEISGSLGGVYDVNGHRTSAAITFKHQKIDPVTRKFVRGRGTLAFSHASPTNPQSILQKIQRHKLKMAIKAWQDLSEDEKKYYRNLALKDPFRSGSNIFVSRYLNNFNRYNDIWDVDFNDWGMNWIGSTPIWNVDFNDW